MNRLASAFASGLLFGIGLLVSGMVRPSKVIGFLDVTGNWDPSLMFVMVGGIGVHMSVYTWITKRSSPLADTSFHIPTKADIDGPLIVGAVLFGIGWGLGGYCPGPAITAIASSPSTAAFVATMIAGMAAYPVLRKAVGTTRG